MWLPPNLHKKVRWCEMLEVGLLQLLTLSLFGNITLSILSLILITVLTVKYIKENHTSAHQ